MIGLEGKKAIVTGGARGLGLAVAQRLSTEGARVAIVDRVETAAAEAAAIVPESIGIGADVSSESDTVRYFDAASEVFGEVDLLHANAGILGACVPVGATETAMFNEVMAVNVWGVFYALRELLRRRSSGSTPAVVATASTGAHRAYAGYGVYAASKHAVLGLVRGAARDHGPEGVRVNAVSPGGMATEMAREAAMHASGEQPTDFVTSPGMAEQVAEIPLGRLGDPADVAAVVVWLLSDEARHVNGASYLVDGGALA